MPPTPRPVRHGRALRRAAQAGLATGLAVTSAAVLLPGSASSAAPAPTAAPVAVEAQSASEPVRVARASRSTRAALPMRTVTKTVAVGPSFSGQASWYGGSFQGRRTANGERFDTNDYTAASKHLPFGTRLRVCHEGCVVVRINDRGPYVSGRVLDLSRAASRAIGYSGVAHVTATPVDERQVKVVDRAALARQQAHERRLAALRRATAARAAEKARQDAAALEVERLRLAAAETPLDENRMPLGLAGALLASSSAGLLGLRRRRT